MKKIVFLLLLFIPLLGFSANYTYYVYPGGSSTTFAIPADEDDCNGDYCNICFVFSYYVTVNGSGYHTGSSYTFSPNRTPGTYVVRINRERNRYSTDCSYTTINTVIDTYTFYVVDFSWMSGSYEKCLEGARVDLSSYINGYSTWLATSLSGTGVSENYFYPSLAGVGTFTITASKSFDNGVCNITKDFNVHKPDFTFSSLGQVCIDRGLIDVRDYVNVLPFTLSGTGVSGYLFNPANAGAGIHTLSVTYTDGYVCSTTKTASVTVNSTFAISAGATYFLCNDAAAVPLVGDPYEGTWTGTGVSGSTFVSSSVNAGSYNLTYTVTKNGCTKSADKAVTVYPLPVVDAGGNLSVCQLDGSVSLNTSGVTPSDGIWSCGNVSVNSLIDNVNKRINISSVQSASYVLTYSKILTNGCANADQRTLTVLESPNIVFSKTNLQVCKNGYLTGYDLFQDVSPITGTWTGAGVVGNKFFSNITGVGAFPLTYTVNNANGCSQTRTIDINVVESLSGSLTLGQEIFICLNHTPVDLSAFPNFPGGIWTGSGVTNGYFYPEISGTGRHLITYTVNSAGCDLVASKYVTVNSLPSIPIITGKTSVCKNETTTLTIENSNVNVNYKWFKDIETNYFSALTSVGYMVSHNETLYVSAVNSYGCRAMENGIVMLNIPSPEGVVTASKDSVYRGEVVQLLYSGTDGVSHLWDLGDGITVTTNNPYHYYYSLGLKDVKLTITTVKGCSIDILKSGIVKVYEKSTGLDDVKNDGFLLYPSPFRSSLVIEFQSGVNRVEIFSFVGRKVFDKTFNQETQVTLEGLNFINGLYLVRVNGVKYSKALKQ